MTDQELDKLTAFMDYAQFLTKNLLHTEAEVCDYANYVEESYKTPYVFEILDILHVIAITGFVELHCQNTYKTTLDSYKRRGHLDLLFKHDLTAEAFVMEVEAALVIYKTLGHLEILGGSHGSF